LGLNYEPLQIVNSNVNSLSFK